MQKIKDQITSYAYDLMKEQFILSSVYQVEKINFFSYKVAAIDSLQYSKYHLVNIIDNKLNCDCFHMDITGIICRHIFAMCNSTQQTDLARITLHEWWLKSNCLNLDVIHFKNSQSRSYHVILIDDAPNANHINPDSLENAANAINAFRAIPNNFSNAKKKKGRPKQEKRLTSFVEIVSTGSTI